MCVTITRMPVLRRAASPALLLLLAILFYWKLTLASQYTWLDSTDLANQVLPWWNEQARQWHSGNFPTWDPNLWGGQPLVGQAQPGAVYPLNWVLFLTRLKDGQLRPFYLNAYFILIHFIAALNCFLLCRYLGRSRLAGIIAGCLFAFGGYVGNIDWPQMINGVIWAPLVFLFLLRATSGIQPAFSSACSGLFLGLCWLSGHHQGPTFVTYAVAFTWLYFIWQKPSTAKLAVLFGIFFIATAGLQIFPALEYGKLARRWVGSEQDPIDWATQVPYFIHRNFSFGPASLLGILIPGVHRQSSPLLGFTGLTLALLGIALAWRADVRVRIFGVIGFGGILLAMGGSSLLHGILYTWAPLFEKARSPHAAIVLFSLAFAVLAAFGFDAVVEERQHLWVQRAIWILTAVTVLVLLAFSASTLLRGMDAHPDDRPILAAFIGLLVCGALMAFRNGSFSRPAFAAVLIILLLTELSNEATYGLPNQLEPNHVSALKATTAHDDVAAYLKTQAGQPIRVTVDDKLVPYNFGDQHGINQMGGYLASLTSNLLRLDLGTEHVRDLFAVTHSIGKDPVQPDWPLVFTGTSGVNVYRNPKAAPRIWTVRTIMALEKETDARHVLNHKDMDVHKLMFILGKAPAIPSGGACGNDTTKLMNYEPTRVVAEAQMTCGGILVLADTYFPGWVALVDGKSQPVLEVYGAVRGVVLSAGLHRVEFQYHNQPLFLGAMSLVSALAGLLILFVRVTKY